MKYFRNSIALAKLFLCGLFICAIANRLSGQLEYDSSFWKQDHIAEKLRSAFALEPFTESTLKNEDEQLAVRQAYDLLEIGDDAKRVQGLAILEQAAILEGSSAAIKYIVGSVYAQDENTEKALEWFDKSLEQFPNYKLAQRNVGLMRAVAGDYEKALPSLIKAVELGATDNTTWALIGLCHARAQRMVASEAAYRKATILDPSEEEWQKGLATALIIQNKHAQAIDVLDELLTTNPDNDIIWIQQGSSFIALDDIENALANFEIVDRLGKATSEVLMLMGQIYIDKGLHPPAIEVFRKALVKDEDPDAKTYIGVAELMIGYGAIDGATTYIPDIRQRFQNELTREQELQLLRIESQIAMAKGDPESFVPILERLIEINPQDGQAILMLADYKSSLETSLDYKAADTYFAQAAKIPKHEVDALIAWASSYVARGRYDDALEKLIRAQTLKPQAHIAEYLERVRQISSVTP